MILFWMQPDAQSRKLIEKTIPDTDFLIIDDSYSPEQKKEIFLDAEIVFGNIPSKWLPEAKKLRWLQLASAGFGEYQDNVQTTQTITNLSGFGKEVIAETILAGILGLYRGLNSLIPAKSEKQWIQTEVRASAKPLYGSQVVILGNGSIGQYTRTLLETFSCSVLSYARSEPAELRSINQLENALQQADIVIACLPHTSETANLLNAERLTNIKQGGIIVNVGRGSLIDEVALVEALNSGEIGGAVIDVSLEEPLPAHHPLWTCPNTILTQHTAGGFDRELLSKVKFFLSNLKRYRSGEPLLNVVDFQRGY